MADIFISYKREERARIVPLAHALESLGYTVWWDLELVAGEKWKRRIKTELDAARCIIVTWTNMSIGEDGLYASEWIEKEAEEGHGRGVMVPAMLDAGRVAWDHKQLQFADLTHWGGENDHAGLAVLVEGVTRLCGVRQPPADNEVAAWAAAEATPALQTYRAFAATYPNSRFVDLAKDRALELEEAADWSALGAAPTLTALTGFLRKWPSRRFADEAEARIHALQAAATRNGATRMQASRVTPSALYRSMGSSAPNTDDASPRPKWLAPALGAAAVALVALLIVVLKPFDGPHVAVAPPPPSEAAAQSGAPATLQTGAAFDDCDGAAWCPKMIVIPAGSFTMGSPTSEAGRYDDEGPQHSVTLATFAAGKYDVTFDQYDACANENVCPKADDQTWGRGNRPVINVSWNDAQTYVKWLSGKSGQTYRLLSEAEWEYAARAGTTTAYYWGDAFDKSRVANGDRTDPVGSHAANAFGLYDMAGNVWQWVEDCYHPNYAGAPVDGAAVKSGDCTQRVLRGGSWGNSPLYLRSAVRIRNDFAYRDLGIGFRVARTL